MTSSELRINLTCTKCNKPSQICAQYDRSSPLPLCIPPGPGDNRYVFTCSQCEGGQYSLKHLNKSWVQVLVTTFYNLQLQTGNTAFELASVYGFIQSFWEVLCSDKTEKLWKAYISTVLLLHPDIFMTNHGDSWSLKGFDSSNTEQQTLELIPEKIIQKRLTEHGEQEYRVKWAGLDEIYSTWEPIENLHPSMLVEEYERSHPNETEEPPGSPSKKQKVELSDTNENFQYVGYLSSPGNQAPATLYHHISNSVPSVVTTVPLNVSLGMSPSHNARASTTPPSSGSLTNGGSGKQSNSAGEYCHQCHARRENTAPCSSCQMKYCPRCLKKYYNIDWQGARQEPKWTCPRCKGLCLCAACRKKRGIDIEREPGKRYVKLQKLVEFNNAAEKSNSNFVFVPSALQPTPNNSNNNSNPSLDPIPNETTKKPTDEAALAITKLTSAGGSPTSTEKPKKKVGRPKKSTTPVTPVTVVVNESDNNTLNNGKLVPQEAVVDPPSLKEADPPVIMDEGKDEKTMIFIFCLENSRFIGFVDINTNCLLSMLRQVVFEDGVLEGDALEKMRFLYRHAPVSGNQEKRIRVVDCLRDIGGNPSIEITLNRDSKFVPPASSSPTSTPPTQTPLERAQPQPIREGDAVDFLFYDVK